VSDDYGWDDPFADDPEAQERARRRAEREARRREQQTSLGDKVQAERAGAVSEPADAPPVDPAAFDDPATAQPTAGQSSTAPPPATADRPVVEPARERTGAHQAVAPGPLWARRALGVVVLLSAIAVAIVAVRAVGDLIGGSDEPAPPVAEAKVSEITIPEGLDRQQIGDLVKEEGIDGDYLGATKASTKYKGFDPAKFGAADAQTLEGFLFPALYELPKKASVKDLVSRQLTALEDNIAEVDFDYAESKNLNVYDVLKIASMIEREIQVPEERKLAAAVIFNRLSAGSPLGIDATIRYEDQNYTEQLTESRLAEPTPYNTRINTGLPPTPIGNPGLASIEAAANPAKSDVFYFVVKPGTCGEHVFVETEQEFLEAEAEYQAALQEQGGSPTEC
jgi:UPF0755 protein